MSDALPSQHSSSLPPISLRPSAVLQVMSFTYMQQRSELIALACSLGLQLALPGECNCVN